MVYTGRGVSIAVTTDTDEATLIPRDVEEYIKKYVLTKANVVGYSKYIGRKIVKGRVTDEPCVVVYVTRKLPVNQLRLEDIIPTEIHGLKTDVVEVGEIRALQADKKGRFRPVLMGVSIGNYAITAGTAGWLFEKKGEVYLGSNAHVLADDPSRDPKNVREKRIVQPGRYDGGTLDDVVGEYVWHKKIYMVGEPSKCPVARVVASTYNAIARLVGSRTRIVPLVEEVNRVDFAVARLKVPYEPRFPDFDPRGYAFVGLGFAGSEAVSCVCKARYILGEGYAPVGVEVAEVGAGGVVEKSGRTSCRTSATVIDPSAVVRVRYDTGYAILEDVVLTTKLLEPGDSGSSVWTPAKTTTRPVDALWLLLSPVTRLPT